MKLLYVADSWPPVSNSAAQQNYSLVKALSVLGCKVTVLTCRHPDHKPLAAIQNVEILKMPPKCRGNNVLRTLGELLLSGLGILSLVRRSHNKKFDAIVFYSPSIFFGPLINYVKWRSKCKVYLILRDIFPDWAYELGLIKSQHLYHFFYFFADLQYSIADYIGIQAMNDLDYLHKHSYKAELLRNWMPEFDLFENDISLGVDSLVDEINQAGRMRILYAGNLGVAQNPIRLLTLARANPEIDFLVAGSGSLSATLNKESRDSNLTNLHFFGELSAARVAQLARLSDFGLIILDERLRTNNIPGKYLFYLFYDLPVVAMINKNNEFAEVLKSDCSGVVIDDSSVGSIDLILRRSLASRSENMLAVSHSDLKKSLMKRYSPEVAAQQILNRVLKRIEVCESKSKSI